MTRTDRTIIAAVAALALAAALFSPAKQAEPTLSAESVQGQLQVCAALNMGAHVTQNEAGAALKVFCTNPEGERFALLIEGDPTVIRSANHIHH